MLVTEPVEPRHETGTIDERPDAPNTEDTTTTLSCSEETVAATAMTLDVAYQSLELVRKANLQIEFGGVDVPENQCVHCFRNERSNNNINNINNNIPTNWRQRWRMSHKAAPCLTCGTPVCKTHRSSEFDRGTTTTICVDCAHLCSTHATVQHLLQQEQQQQQQDDTRRSNPQLAHLLDVYDRALLLLQYSLPFLPDVATALEARTSRHNLVGLGSSATGVVAGSLGVAAACVLFTPAGPPLLLASMLFGGGATAVTAGSEAVNYRCEPNQMADRILTLWGIVTSIAQLPKAILEQEHETTTTVPLWKSSNDSQSTLHWTRTAMNGLKPLPAGALSAVSIVTEARELRQTVDKIRAGNPCDKAMRLRHMTLDDLPDTERLLQDLRQGLAERNCRPIEEATNNELLGAD